LMAEKYEVDIKVWINPEGKDQVSPFSHGSEKHTQIMKTDSLKQALEDNAGTFLVPDGEVEYATLA